MNPNNRTSENAGSPPFSKDPQQKPGSDEIKEQSEKLVDDAKAKSRQFFSKQKGLAAQTVGDIADAMDAAARELQEKEKESAADYVDMAAGNLRRLSDSLRDRDVDQLAQQVRDFAQRQPGLLLGGSLVAGFALSRFFKSSSEQREQDDEEAYEPNTDTDGHAMGRAGASFPRSSDENLDLSETPAERDWKDRKDDPLTATDPDLGRIQP